MGDNTDDMPDIKDVVQPLLPVEVAAISPIIKNAKGKYVSSRQKIMIVNIYKGIVSNSPCKTSADIIASISKSTGIGRETINKTISEYKRTKTVTPPNKKRAKASLFDKVDDLDRTGLRQKVHSIWLKRELPTIDRILFDVNADPSLPNFKRTTLYTTIKKLDFVFTKRKRCSVLTEREDLIVWRRKYLYDVRKYRKEGRTIYYLDGTWLNAGDRVDRVCNDNNTVLSKRGAFNRGHTTGLPNPSGMGNGLVALHVGSKNGFLPGGLLCFVSEKNAGDYRDDFKRWFESIIPSLDPNSVVVVDNAPCNAVETEKYPNCSWKKADVLEWLVSNNVVLDRPMLRPELLAKCRELRPRHKSYVIDNLAKDNGHAVLRLPPYHGAFNPMESAWATVKQYVTWENTTYEIDDVRRLVNTAAERVTPQDWTDFIHHAIEEEDRIWNVDDIMDDMIDAMEPCVLTKTGDTTSTYDSE